MSQSGTNLSHTRMSRAYYESAGQKLENPVDFYNKSLRKLKKLSDPHPQYGWLMHSNSFPRDEESS